MGQRQKSESHTGIEPMIFLPQLDALTTDLRVTLGELVILTRFVVTRVLRTAGVIQAGRCHLLYIILRNTKKHVLL